jgi:hypothetical protein
MSCRCGPAHEKKVVIADGAEWIWNNAAAHFPGAIQIVDIFHARQHLWEVARQLYPGQDAEQKRWIAIHQKLLEKIPAEADYYDNNKERMRYPKFRAQNLFIGSGVIEAGCKTSLVPAASSRTCSGQFVAQTPFWRSAVPTSTAGLRIIGRAARRTEFHFHGAHPPETLCASEASFPQAAQWRNKAR